MSEDKSYKRYKEDPFVKVPALAWLMDRPKVMLPVLGVGILSIGAILGTGWQSYENITAPPENTTPYLQIEPVSYLGKDWAIDLINEQPPVVDAWEISENYRGRPIIETSEYGNPAQEFPDSLLMTASATGGGVSTRVQVYGTGQAAQAFEDITTALEESEYTPSSENVSQSKILRFTDGFIINTGDAIVGVTTNDETQLDALESFYLPLIESTISESQCASIHPRPNDYQRSFYYDSDEYTGLIEKETLETQINYSNLPTPSSLSLLSVEDEDAVQPEAPLPESFDDIPDDPERPYLTSRPETREGFKKVASYQVEDVNGPGCGWEWTAHTQPIHDLTLLEQEKEATLEATQQAVNDETREYISTHRNWALQMAGYMPVINAWNQHVNKVNSIHQDWRKLREGRQEIQSDWYNYVEAHNRWREFPQLQREAREDYNEQVQECRAAQEDLEDWEENYEQYKDDYEAAREAYEEELEAWEEREAARSAADAEESPAPEDDASASPSPTPEDDSDLPDADDDPSPTFEFDEDIPERPEGCDTPPERPSILDTERGSEPTPPEVPENVTIPNSWPQPVGVELNEYGEILE